jgi:serine/threonine protein phosphatase PrpC
MSQSSGLQLESASFNDIGLRRSVNQDTVRMQVARPGSISQHSLFVVADGVGGNLPEGDEASKTAAEGLIKHYFVQPEGMPLVERLARATEGAHGEVRTRAFELRQPIIGTTMTALAIAPDGRAQAVSLGDSRLYRVRAGLLELLTTDQVVGGGPGKRSTRLAGYIGQPEPLKPGYVPLEVQPGDVYLLCSDGLWSKVPEDDLRDVLASQPVELAANTLKELVFQSGAPDNLSGIIVRVGGAPEPLLLEQPLPRQRVKLSRTALGITGIALLVVASILAILNSTTAPATPSEATTVAVAASNTTSENAAQEPASVTPTLAVTVALSPTSAPATVTATFTRLPITPRLSATVQAATVFPTDTPMPPLRGLETQIATLTSGARLAASSPSPTPFPTVVTSTPSATLTLAPQPYQSASCDSISEESPVLIVRSAAGVFVRTGPGRDFRSYPAGLGDESQAAIAGYLRQDDATWYYVCPPAGSVVLPGWVNGDPALVTVEGNFDGIQVYQNS